MRQDSTTVNFVRIAGMAKSKAKSLYASNEVSFLIGKAAEDERRKKKENCFN